eukprot:427485_1
MSFWNNDHVNLFFNSNSNNKLFNLNSNNKFNTLSIKPFEYEFDTSLPKVDHHQFYLILAGTTNPPSEYNAQSERDEQESDCKEDGNYLKQIIKNMQIVEHSIKWDKEKKLFNSYRNLRAKKKDALDQIVGLFQTAKQNKANGCNWITIYYTGHGSGGNWCYSDGTIKLDDIVRIANKYGKDFTSLHIYSQCCQSGNWCVQLENYKNKINIDISIESSSLPWKSSYGSNNGSTWTRYKFNDEGDYATKNHLKFVYACLNTSAHYTRYHYEVKNGCNIRIYEYKKQH